jgi:pimeloyl-ACP methyl ester carboxylesterase
VRRQTALRIVFAVGAIALVVYTGFKLTSDANQVQLAAPIATDARTFTLGTLTFTACQLPQDRSGATTSAFCAPFSVPENRADPNGRKLNLRLALIKSDALRADRDIVVYIAGGPGQSAVGTWPQIAAALAPLRKHHHILLVDQRGTGRSNALTCKSEGDASADGSDLSLDLDRIRRNTRDCLVAVEGKADPRYYTTTVAAADLEAARQALGAPPFDLVGVSYGTRLAQQYLMHYPQGVRSAVLDSVVPNQLVLGEDIAQNLDAALKAQFALCTHTPACAKVFGDPYANLIKLRDRLRSAPQTLDYRDPITFAPAQLRLDAGGLARLVRMFAYTPETAALLPLSISEGLRSDFTPLAGQEKLLTVDLADISENAMQLSVVCSEDSDLLTPRPQDADTLLGTTVIDFLKAACEIWPHGARPADFHAALETRTPVLILEGDLDPVTPPRYGAEVLKGLSDGRLLVAKGQGHNVIGRGCIPRLVGEFVDKLDPQRLDAKCMDALGPIPTYIDFNGSSP